MTKPPFYSFGSAPTTPSSGADKVIIDGRNLGKPADAAAMLQRQISVCRAKIEGCKMKPAAAKELAEAEQRLVQLNSDLARAQSLIDSPPVSAPAEAVDDTEPVTEEEHDRELVRLANQGLAPGQVAVYGDPSPPADNLDRPLTARDLNALMGAFQKLDSQQKTLEKKLSRWPMPNPGKLAPGSDPKDADAYEVTGAKPVKSTANIPRRLRDRMKLYEVQNPEMSLQAQIVAAIEEFLVKRGA